MGPRTFDDELGRTELVENFSVQQLVSHSPVGAFAVSECSEGDC